MTSQEYIEHIWPAVEDANSSAEGFSQISKDMIVVLGDNRDPPCTDKGSIIRSRTYVEFADEIENAYQKLGDSVEGSLRFDEIQLQQFLINLCGEHFGLKLTSENSDFYSAGLDSLMAIQLYAHLKGTVL